MAEPEEQQEKPLRVRILTGPCWLVESTLNALADDYTAITFHFSVIRDIQQVTAILIHNSDIRRAQIAAAVMPQNGRR
jgi:hypothetical protein